MGKEHMSTRPKDLRKVWD